ncbi:MAG: hypothetical protein ABSG43_25980 [Solirubrobacteraceae bacterium]
MPSLQSELVLAVEELFEELDDLDRLQDTAVGPVPCRRERAEDCNSSSSAPAWIAARSWCSSPPAGTALRTRLSPASVSREARRHATCSVRLFRAPVRTRHPRRRPIAR